MIIDGKNILEEEVIAQENSFYKKYNNIFLTQHQINILKKYNINIDNYTNIKELIYDIEEYLNGSDMFLEDLEWVSQELSEYNYYNNTNK